MRRCLLSIFIAIVSASAVLAEQSYRDIDLPPHLYRQRTPRDSFTQMRADLESGRVAFDTSSEKAFVSSFLARLRVPVSSQMLVFSNTSLQLRLISPRNPRALYFNEEVSVGYVPGGRIEVLSLDPDLGGIFYIFDIPRGGEPVRLERSERCMNCHAAEDTGHVPGMVIKSVVPGPTGGSLTAYRQGLSGHAIPFAQRFGGWHVTGRIAAGSHLGNVIGRLSAGTLTKLPNEPGQSFDLARYPVATSDVLAQLLHEHQAGFVNRVVEAGYRARTDQFIDNGQLSAAHAQELDAQARLLTRYILFADEAPLPPGGAAGDAAFQADFLRNRRATPAGASLKDLDLRTRLFRHRCSYMLYSTVFQGLPAPMKERVYRRLAEALNVATPDAEYAYLASAEKQTIRAILGATLGDLPRDW